jgi:2-oxo-3-hexenedioate decarboxylase
MIMAITNEAVFHYASILDEAVTLRKEVTRLTAKDPAISVEDGYRIQEAGLRLREARGEVIVGFKMGLTSRAKMQQMGVSSPIAGVLLNSMKIPSGGRIMLSDRIHPKVEPELAFITNRELRGNISREQFLAATASVVPAIEVIDSRFLNFDFTLADVLADNCSSSGFILGSEPMSLSDFHAKGLKLDELKLCLRINGELRAEGVSSAVLGHPVDSCLALLAGLDRQGKSLPAGAIVLSGGATAALAVSAGDEINLEIEGLGNAQARVV